MFVGPKLQKQLDTLHPELSRVADYGVLTLLSKPLFWLLEHAHSFVRNWGLAIILVTFLLKLLFYPLSEKAGRSMARMRALAPRMKALQETYKDDRTKLGQATMELYKTEKVNPVAGCLPMLIQMPVFLAFYWVLLESVEMRQAPFFGWINDLSARDPVLHPSGAQRSCDVGPVEAEPAAAGSDAGQDLPAHAHRVLGDVRVVPRGPGAVLGDEHRPVDPAAVEHQPENQARGSGAQEVARRRRAAIPQSCRAAARGNGRRLEPRGDSAACA